jgi:hypothetical protein
MNVEIGTDAAQFPEKKYINEIFVAVLLKSLSSLFYCTSPFCCCTNNISFLGRYILPAMVLKFSGKP